MREGKKRHTQARGVQAQNHSEVGPVFVFNGTVFHRTAKGVAETDAGIAEIAEDHFLHRTGGDHEIKQNICAGSAQREIFLVLPQNFMTQGERHRMTETGDKNRIAVFDVIFY